MDRREEYTRPGDTATELLGDDGGPEVELVEGPEVELVGVELVELVEGEVSASPAAEGVSSGARSSDAGGLRESSPAGAGLAEGVELVERPPVEGVAAGVRVGDAKGTTNGRPLLRAIPGGRVEREAVGVEGPPPGVLEPRSEAQGSKGSRSLAPSHTNNAPPRRSAGQGNTSTASTSAPRRRAEPRAGAPLTEASTGAPCDETGRSAQGPGVRDLPGAVTPGRYDGDTPVGSPVLPPSGGGGPLGLVPSGDGSGGVRVIRSALDWLTVLCLAPVTRARWEELGALADGGIAELVVTPVGSVPLEVRRLGRDLVARSVAGLYLLVREPSRTKWSEAPRCAETTERGLGRGSGPGRCEAGDGRGTCPKGRARVDGAEGELVELVEVIDARDELDPCGHGPPAVCRTRERVELAELGLHHPKGDDVRDVYGCEMQVQGTAFSSATAGGEVLVAGLWQGVAAWLWPGLRDAAGSVEPFTRVGRVDVAFDAAFTDDPGERAVQWGIYADGHHDGAFRRWSTRARKHRSEETVREGEDAAANGDGAGHVPVSGRRALLGKATAGRTLYLGSSEYVLVCVYERSKKRDGDWSVLGPTLEACGWDGASQVVRCEFRASRRWLGDQVPACPDGSPMFPRAHRERGEPAGLRAAELTLAQFLRALPALVGEFPTRFRHTDPMQDGDDAPRVRDRRSSPWWEGIVERSRSWVAGGGEVGRVVSTRRAAAADRTAKAVRSGLVRLVALRGKRHLSEVLPEVFELWRASDFDDVREDLLRRVRARYGIAEPDAEGLAAVAAAG